MAGKMSMRGQWARTLLYHELCKEIPIHQKKGNRFGEKPEENVPSDGRNTKNPFRLPRDVSLDEDELDTKGTVRSIPPLPEWPHLKVCIIGAGISGLYTAMILDSLKIPNLTYEILESSDRIGGRLYTHYFDEVEEHQYYDIGAMRFPRLKIMNRTFDLFRRIGIEEEFVKYYLSSADGAINTPKYFNERLHVSKPEIKEPFDVFKVSKKNKGHVPTEHVEKGPDDILEEIYGPFKERLAKDWLEGFEKLMEWDNYSTRGYVMSQTKYNDYSTTQWLETMDVGSGLWDQAFSESVIDSFDFDVPVPEAWTGMKERWVCIEGGSSVIIDGMLSTLSTLPTVSKRITSIAIERSKPKDSNMRVQVAGERDPRYYSTVFNSTTLGAAQRMDLSKAELHPVQKDAIRSLKYDASCKVAIRFKSAWWIKGGIKFGGTAKTDSPIRVCVYPSYNIDDDVDSPAVLLCSYTWAQDAQRMGTLIGSYKPGKNEELKEVILNDLAKLHPFISLEKLYDQFYEMHAFDWYADPNYSGAFALFGPGQFKNLYPILSRPTADGNLHFIGEATSTHHAWVVGALNSSYRGVYNMLKKYQLEKTPMRRHWQKKIIELQTKWGTIDELDTRPEGTAHLNVLLGRLRGDEMVVVDF